MKKLLFSLLLLASCTPVRYVYVDPKDSTIKKQRVIYQDVYDSHIPLYFNYNYYSRPYYNPIIIQRQRPIIVNPRIQRNLPPRPPRHKR